MNDGVIVSWIDNGSGSRMTSDFVLGAAIDRFLPFFVLAFVFDASVYIAKLVYGHWNYQIAAMATIEKIISVVLFITFCSQPDLFNASFITEARTILGSSANELFSLAANAAKGFGIFLAVVVSIDIIVTWVKTIKSQLLEQ
jgi:hypothetical protein